MFIKFELLERNSTREVWLNVRIIRSMQAVLPQQRNNANLGKPGGEGPCTVLYLTDGTISFNVEGSVESNAARINAALSNK